MKILIADNEPRRYERLISALGEAGIPRSDIHMVQCTADAQDRMEQTHYDLLLLDILIPLRVELDDDVSNSLDLLMEIRNGDFLNRPRYVLGITADLEVTKDVRTLFADYTWTVLEYSASNDEWVRRTVNCATFVQRDAPGAEGAAVDLAVLCALATPELSEVLKLPWNWSSPRPIDDSIFVRDGFFESNGKKYTVCATSAPRMGMVSTALTAASIISLLKPRMIVMTGICAGVRGKVKMGDVLFADPAWDFQSGKRVRDGKNSQFSIRPHHIPAPHKIRRHVEQIRDDKDALMAITGGYSGDPPGILSVALGPIASGSAVLADGEVVKEIRTQHQELIGIEMEIYGLYAAAYAASSPQPAFFALKGVCDFADPDKEDRYQQYAAYTSASVMRLLLERYGDRIIG
jgi:nucleoside phosphorylase/CheY-like chemotaxis protein